MIEVSEARARVLERFQPTDVVEVPIREARGMALAQDVHAPHPLPRFDNSAMDGYAVRAADIQRVLVDSSVNLTVIGEVRAGEPGDLEVTHGTAARIMTGAPVPKGADAIVPVEDTEESGSEVMVRAATELGRHIRPAGDDLKEGDLLVGAGSELGPGEMALLASMGISPVQVHRRPRVAVLVTGDELVPPEQTPRPGQIRDSNSVALVALIEEAGGEAQLQPSVPDDLAGTRSAFAVAAKGADLVVSSGGVAVGRYDFVKEVIEELGSIDLWRVAMQPGKPVVLGSIGDVPFLGLPGNPVSIHVGFEQFVRPAIRKMRGVRDLLRPRVKARLTQALDKSPGRMHFVRVRLDYDDGTWLATPTGPQGSHIQSSLVACDGVAVFDLQASHLDVGDEVTVEVWKTPGEVPG